VKETMKTIHGAGTMLGSFITLEGLGTQAKIYWWILVSLSQKKCITLSGSANAHLDGLEAPTVVPSNKIWIYTTP
jgi:hypothetical protein